MVRIQSWGRFPTVQQGSTDVQWRTDLIPVNEASQLPFGQGRSYGDCCLNDGGQALSTRFLDRLIFFDRANGVIRCESGMTLKQVLALCVPAGWFIPVSPGTQYVSVGGAVANDVHGKNHHRSGTFGSHVRCFELLRSSGERLLCSAHENADLFHATIAGLGLTGLITWVEFTLRKIESPLIDNESIKFGSLDEFFVVSESSDKEFEYTVAWLDCISTGSQFGRGIFMRGNHAQAPVERSQAEKLLRHGVPADGFLSVPIDFPAFVLNRWSVKAFNQLYYGKQLSHTLKKQMHYRPFFYPLDSVRNWNRIYGKQGFLQFQCVIPPENKQEVLRNILKTIVASGNASFLAVLKEFGNQHSPGLLSFPTQGATLCLDFAHRGDDTLTLLRRLDDMTADAGGRIYPAKDAVMSAAHFQRYFPRWQELEKLRDSNFSSSFWRRVTQGAL